MTDMDYSDVMEAEQAPAAGDASGMPPHEPLEPVSEGVGGTVPESGNALEAAGAETGTEAEIKDGAEHGEVDKKLKKIGMINPDTNEPVKDRDEYEELRGQRMSQERQEFMEKYGMDEKQYYDFVGGLPEVRAARIAQQRAISLGVETELRDELRQIREMDKSVSTLEDLKNNPGYDRIVEQVRLGNSLADAYRLTNFDALMKSAAEREKQAAINSIHGKSYMTAAAQRQGGGMEPVPEQVMDQYRIFNPGASEEDIQRHYNRAIKGN